MMRHVTYNVYVARVLQVGLLEVTVLFKFCLGHGAMDTIKREKKKSLGTYVFMLEVRRRQGFNGPQ